MRESETLREKRAAITLLSLTIRNMKFCNVEFTCTGHRSHAGLLPAQRTLLLLCFLFNPDTSFTMWANSWVRSCWSRTHRSALQYSCRVHAPCLGNGTAGRRAAADQQDPTSLDSGAGSTHCTPPSSCTPPRSCIPPVQPLAILTLWHNYHTLAVCPTVRPSVCQSIHLSIYLLAYLCLSICLSVSNIPNSSAPRTKGA